MKKLNTNPAKVNKLLFLFSLLVLFNFSCSDLLDVDADNSISGDVLVDQASIEKALNGAYYNLMGIYDGSDGGELLGGDFKLMATLLTRTNIQEVSWDETNAPDYEDFIDKDIKDANLRVESNWRRGYETINIVNDILDNIDKISDASAKDKIEGEALAIRGILYFEMVRLWAPQYESSTIGSGAIPLILDPINTVGDIGIPTKATVGAIYTQVEDDLTAASDLLQSLGMNGTRISYYACQAYLAKMAMQQNDYITAEGYLNTVIGGPYSLTSSPQGAFSNAANSTEDILAVQQTAASNTGSNSTGSGLVTFFASLPNIGLSAMRIIPSSLNSSFLSNNPMYADIDSRSQIDETTSSTTTADDITTSFYRDPVNTVAISSSKFLRNTDVVPVIRLAEMHLDRAEARFEQNPFVIDATALTDLNAIRTRAGLPALLVGDFASPNAFYDSIIVERNREFLYEGIIFHDLKRQAANGLTVQITFGNDPLDNKFILPIPQSECDASPGLCD